MTGIRISRNSQSQYRLYKQFEATHHKNELYQRYMSVGIRRYLVRVQNAGTVCQTIV